MSKLLAMIAFLGFYLLDVLKSNFRVAHDVLTPRHRMKPGIIAMDVNGMTDRQILMTANLITMTPGTLGLGVSDDKRTLYLHVMYLDGTPEETARQLEHDYGRRVRDVF